MIPQPVKIRQPSRIIIPERNKEQKINEFVLSFFLLNSYLPGNLGIACHYFQYSFYFLEDFILSSLLNNELLTQPNFLLGLRNFFGQKKKITYLITSGQNMHWYNNNSLLLAKNKLPSPTKPLFFLLYDFDWLHILELLEIIPRIIYLS